MDFGRFEGFWQRLARTRLGAAETMAVEAILAGLLERWRTCVICHVLWDRTFDLVSGWQQVLDEDPEERVRFIQQYTWCNRHGWFVKELVMPRILGRIHRELLSGLADRVGGILAERPAGSTEDGVNWAQSFVGERRCPLCEDEAALEEAVLRVMAQGLVSGGLRSVYAGSAGCCIPHLERLVRAVSDREAVRFLLEATAEQTKRLAEELDRYEAETENHQRRYGSAADAPVRAMTQWVGMRGMVQDRAPCMVRGSVS